MIGGWKAETSMRADLVTDTLNTPVWLRGRAAATGATDATDATGLIHHTDAAQVLTQVESAARRSRSPRQRPIGRSRRCGCLHVVRAPRTP